ncbi:deleted in malignant brain tumors 1 protein-like [Patiria miniata]|uniref:SRCR domain-containing protein n=1 Tax=Patiria miniata TaxID=46514 RepID=A0A914BPD0_PATMI|nr:deleted in malignant brain tumors 1 protein-like [Patiria miniata]
MLGVTVFCVFLLGTATALDGDVRLSGGSSQNGRVEVLHGGRWGSICLDGWDFNDALVVCKQLGFPWLNRDDWNYDGGNLTELVWLSNVQCKGSETRLDECANDGWTDHQCAETRRAAAVACMDQEEFKGQHFFVILGDGNGPSLLENDGRVMLGYYKDLGIGTRIYLVCDQGWDLADANVICRQDGHYSAKRALTDSYFGNYRPLRSQEVAYLATDFACIGNESKLIECPANFWFQDNCTANHQAGVLCNRIKEPEDFQLRLLGGSNANEGRVEFHVNGTWGSLCLKKDYTFFDEESDVICRQLGLGYGLEAPQDDRFGRGSGPVVFPTYVVCSGSESSFAQCYMPDEPDQECLNLEGSSEASVICSGPIPGDEATLDQCNLGRWFGNDCTQSTLLGLTCSASAGNVVTAAVPSILVFASLAVFLH